LLADDHDVVRTGLRLYFTYDASITVVGEASDGRQAVDRARALRPAVILMDIEMPLLSGLEATRMIIQDRPDAKVIMLSAHSSNAYVERAIEYGAVGYLPKQESPRVVRHAISIVQEGGTYFSPSLSPSSPCIGTPARGDHGSSTTLLSLTPRELEVLQLITDGLSNKMVAARLGICIKTAEKHREHLMRKLDIHDIAGLTRYVLCSGLFGGIVQSA
jgi:DNA-binding NarL/FixJ family response regulator